MGLFFVPPGIFHVCFFFFLIDSVFWFACKIKKKVSLCVPNFQNSMISMKIPLFSWSLLIHTHLFGSLSPFSISLTPKLIILKHSCLHLSVLVSHLYKFKGMIFILLWFILNRISLFSLVKFLKSNLFPSNQFCLEIKSYFKLKIFAWLVVYKVNTS